MPQFVGLTSVSASMSRRSPDHGKGSQAGRWVATEIGEGRKLFYADYDVPGRGGHRHLLP